ncbi:MAG: P-loop NTPase fold protein [Bacilli bacterium]
MNDNNIIKEIQTYMKNPLNYALLLEGDWGSGKTYFVKNNLKKLSTIYISLYGINSISNLSFQLFYEIIKTKNNKVLKKFLSPSIKSETIGTISNVILNNIENKFNISIKELFSLISKINLDNKLIIFDDLERTTIPINEVLGFLNTLVEHNKAKILIIANEKELPNQEEYHKFKEKLIYQTYKYVPQLDQIYDKLVEKESEIFKENKSFVVTELKRKDHYNIRTMQFIIQRYKELEYDLNNIFSKMKNKDIIKIIKKDIFKYLVIVSREYKMGNQLPNFTDDGKISYYELMENTYFTITSFKFINDYILGFPLELEEVEETLISYSHEIVFKTSIENNPLQIIDCWWEVEDETIQTNTEKILESLEKNEYEYDLYPKILIYLLDIKQYGFGSRTLYNGLEFMKNNIKKSKEVISLGYRIINPINDNIKSQYDKLKNELDEIVDTHNKSLQDNNFMSFMSKDVGEMGKTLYTSCSDAHNLIIDNKSLLNTIEIKNILYIVNNGNSTDIRFLIYIFNELYKFANVKEIYPDELIYINELLEELKMVDNKKFSKMKQFNFDDLVKTINELKEKFN